MKSITLIVIAAAILFAQQPAPILDSHSSRLRNFASTARAQGTTSFTVPKRGPNIRVRNIDEALRAYSIIVVEPFETQTVTTDDFIFTWYKCHLINVLSRVTNPTRPTKNVMELSPNMEPTSLVPLAPTEILLLVFGGAAVVDGIQVFDYPTDPMLFQTGHRYLLFSTLSADSTVATAPLEKQGAFDVTNDGLIPLESESPPLINDAGRASVRAFEQIITSRH